MQRCLRQIWFTAALFDFEVHALHVPGKHNQFADYLSCWHSEPLVRASFHRLCRDSNQTFCFQDVDIACFSFDVAWHYCHIFVLFCFPRGSGQHFQPDVSLIQLESFSSLLLTLAHAPSTQKNIAAHICSYQTFCELRALQPFPLSVQSSILYISYLVAQKRAYGTILSHISSHYQLQVHKNPMKYLWKTHESFFRAMNIAFPNFHGLIEAH